MSRSAPYLDQRLLILQEDLPLLGDGGGAIEIHQLIEGVELLLPQEVLPRGVAQHLEVLYLVTIARTEGPDASEGLTGMTLSPISPSPRPSSLSTAQKSLFLFLEPRACRRQVPTLAPLQTWKDS